MDNLAHVNRNFNADIADHQITVERLGELTKLSARGKDFFGWFDVVAWGDHLVITGDMGSFVFHAHGARDMISFFGRGNDIHPRYWAEKVRAGEYEQFSQQVMRERLIQWAKDACEPSGLDRYDLYENDPDTVAAYEQRVSALTDAIEREILAHEIENEREAFERMQHFEHDGMRLRDYDVYEWDLREYTVRYLWCCKALRWASQQLQAVATQTAPAAP